jgi:hypothetical protein
MLSSYILQCINSSVVGIAKYLQLILTWKNAYDVLEQNAGDQFYHVYYMVSEQNVGGPGEAGRSV